MSQQKLVPEAKNGLSKFKNEVAGEMGVPFTDYNGNLSSKLIDTEIAYIYIVDNNVVASENLDEIMKSFSFYPENEKKKANK